MLTLTGLAMIAMSWVAPAGAVMIIIGALIAAVALDDMLGITAGDATPLDVQAMDERTSRALR
jgi:hypothetical protein